MAYRFREPYVMRAVVGTAERVTLGGRSRGTRYEVEVLACGHDEQVIDRDFDSDWFPAKRRKCVLCSPRMSASFHRSLTPPTPPPPL